MTRTWKRGTGEDDLSDEAAGSLAVSGALASVTSDNDAAQTAPGSPPGQSLETDPVAAPHVKADRRDFRRIAHGQGV